MKVDKPIIFFDGVCNLCNGAVDFILRKDRKESFLIASLQGQSAKNLLPESDHQNLKSVVVLNGDQKLYKSSAIFFIAGCLGGVFWLLKPFQILPRFLTDWVYDFVASRRYKVFGKRNTCRIPTEAEQKHFLD